MSNEDGSCWIAYNGEFYNGFNTLPTSTPEASTDAFGVGWIPQVRWTRAQSSKLLFEAGLAYYDQPYEQNPRPEVGPLDLPARELATGRLFGANGHTIPSYTSWTKSYSSMAAASGAATAGSPPAAAADKSATAGRIRLPRSA